MHFSGRCQLAFWSFKKTFRSLISPPLRGGKRVFFTVTPFERNVETVGPVKFLLIIKKRYLCLKQEA